MFDDDEINIVKLNDSVFVLQSQMKTLRMLVIAVFILVGSIIGHLISISEWYSEIFIAINKTL